MTVEFIATRLDGREAAAGSTHHLGCAAVSSGIVVTRGVCDVGCPIGCGAT
jgi:hypothetical protein